MDHEGHEEKQKGIVFSGAAAFVLFMSFMVKIFFAVVGQASGQVT
ncbi:hypothetical protein DSLASN_11970 [Desulfoluna limicola]|uniref:Uncharacterized protein n=1 Tax=Desulfoluna limicola TaxID=2810562 RepID=A0ABN6F1R1_9BACT|nr:hypothetical protein [Desulfoluna limicola]BCS95565.1 hypothetical protein DSLASN_11970 [Desulfoluna limicola]